MRKKLGTSDFSNLAVDFGRGGGTNAGIIFCGNPYLSVMQNERTITFAISDYRTMSGFFVTYKFAKTPKHDRAWHGAAKIVAQEVLRTLNRHNISTVIFTTIGTQEISAALKSGIEHLRRKGLKVL